MITIRYESWLLRGYAGPVWQVYVTITGNHGISELVEVKARMNQPPVKGLVIAINSSRALERLGWKKQDDFYYKVFD